MSKQSFGPINAVKCPWCEKPLDFSDIDQQFSGGDFGGSSVGQNISSRGLNSKEAPKASCDHCGRSCVVTGLFRTPIVVMEGNNKRGSFWLNNVKCPYCGQHQSFVDMYRQQQGYEGSWGQIEDDERIDDAVLGAKITCDQKTGTDRNGNDILCPGVSTIKAINKTPYIRIARA